MGAGFVLKSLKEDSEGLFCDLDKKCIYLMVIS